MPKLITNVEGTAVRVSEMRTQMVQILSKLTGDATVTFAFRMEINDYKPRSEDAKS